MLLPKSFYFFNFAASAALIPFLPLFYQQAGLNGYQIGLLAGIPPLITIFSAPVWGALGDYTRQYKRLLIVGGLGLLASVYALSLARSFATLASLVIAYAFFVSPVIPMVDHTTMRLLGERKDQYGKQRLWGAVGWGVAAPIIGMAAERVGLQWSFYGNLALMFAAILVITRLPISKTSLGIQFWSGLRGLLSNRQLAVFLVIVLVGGTGMAMASSFLFLHIETLGASRSLMGISLTFATISELPVLYFSDRLLRRFGALRLILFSLAALVVRVMAYSFLKVPWMVLPVQLLHGMTFSLMWVSGVTYVTEIAPAGMGATSLSLFTSVMSGMGGMLGGLIGGWLYDTVGTAMMFRWVGLSVLAFLILVQSIDYFLKLLKISW